MSRSTNCSPWSITNRFCNLVLQFFQQIMNTCGCSQMSFNRTVEFYYENGNKCQGRGASIIAEEAKTALEHTWRTSLPTPLIDLVTLPDLRSHIFIVLSREAETALMPSEVIAKAVISPLCPTRMSANAPPASDLCQLFGSALPMLIKRAKTKDNFYCRMVGSLDWD